MACHLVSAKPLSEPMMESTNFCEILSEIHLFLFNEIHLKLSYAKRQQLCLGLNV